MDEPTTRRAAIFKALGNPTRLRIFEFLCDRCGPVALEPSGAVRPVDGATVGEVCCSVTGDERITSTLSTHLKELRQAGLIVTRRQGKHIVCTLDPRALDDLAAYFTTMKEHGCGCP